MHERKKGSSCVLALKLKNKNFPELHRILYTHFLVTAPSLVSDQSFKWARQGNELKPHAGLTRLFWGRLRSSRHLLCSTNLKTHLGTLLLSSAGPEPASSQVCHPPELNSEHRGLCLESWVVWMCGRSWFPPVTARVWEEQCWHAWTSVCVSAQPSGV